MRLHQKLFTGVLLLLIGIVLGALLMIYRGGIQPNDHAEVQVTEVKRSSAGAEDERASGVPEVPFQNVAGDLTPSVVYIESSVSMDGRGMRGEDYHEFNDGFWDRFMDRRAQTIGSGVIISEDGYILTNNHVVGEENGGIRINLTDKRHYEARVVGRDPSTDLAVLKIDATDLEPAVLGDSDQLEVGDWVMAVGNPFQLQSTVTAGIVSALGRDVNIIRDQMPIEHFIQTDAAINQGNSGGALVNTNGELVGINTAIATESGSYEGYGFAVPINMAFKIARDIIEYGEVRRGMLGVSIGPMTQERAEALNMERIRGVEILDIASDGSAARAGIENGDVILKVGEYEVNEPNQLQARIARLDPEDQVDITLYRDNEEITKNLRLSDMHDEAIASWRENQSTGPQDLFIEPYEDELEVRDFEIGLEVAEITHEGQPQLIILRVLEGSPADRAELRTEQRILEVSGTAVDSLDELEDVLSTEYGDGEEVQMLMEAEDGSQQQITIPQN